MIESFSYKANKLGFEGENGWVDLEELSQTLQKPHYIYNISSLKRRISALKDSLGDLNYQIHYAMKANAFPKVMQVFKEMGCGVDTVSGGEVQYALEQGFEGKDIILSGVGKSRKELLLAIEKGVYQINIESLSELKRILSICKEKQLKANFGVRINPNIKVDTHPYITTGFRENKFGVPETQLQEVAEITKAHPEQLNWQGLSVHIGSQIQDMNPLAESARALVRIKKQLSSLGIDIRVLDAGGGVGIDYKTADETKELENIATYGASLREELKDFDGQLLLEPGRTLVGRCGVLLTEVEYVKDNGFKNFAIVSSGMNHLMRPCLYQAHHRILPALNSEATTTIYDVVGPICESSDVLGYDRALPKIQEGQWLAVMDAGAYGSTMSNNYNMHEMPGELGF